MTDRTTPPQYSGWTRERFGPVLGLSLQQAALLCLLVAPPLLAMARGRWLTMLICGAACAPLAALVVVPVRGRPLFRWLVDAAFFGVGRSAGWTSFRSAAVSGEPAIDADLPGVLAHLVFHDGPPFGPFQRPVCVVQNPDVDGWTAVARVRHPGLGTAASTDQAQAARDLGALFAHAAIGEQVSRLAITVRSVPSDGEAREAWVHDHRWPGAPAFIEQVGVVLEDSMITASVEHELFVAVTVSESAVRRGSRDAGGGVAGRARVLYRTVEGIEQSMRDVGVNDVTWLTTEQLSEAIRTGYNPGAGAAFERARQIARRGGDIRTDLPLAAAGPVEAPSPSARRYHHDGYTSVAYAILLPEHATVVGALARVLAPSQAGERRCLTLHYEPLGPEQSRRKLANTSWAIEIADEAKRSKGFRVDRRHTRRMDETSRHEQQVADGHSLVRVAAAAAVTVPTEWNAEDHAARFETDVRASGYIPLRADLGQDSAFVAACVPLAVGLRGRSDR